MNEVLFRRFGGLPGSLARMVDQVCDRFETAWQSGERPSVEKYLSDVGEEERTALLSELLDIELVYRFPKDLPQVRAWSSPAASGSASATTLSTTTWVPANTTAPFEKAAGPDESSPTAASPSVPGYQVLGLIGKGGMGVVYKARQVGLDRLVALKMILHIEHASADARRRFQAEAQAVARLQHPNIVQIHEVAEHQGQPYFSLEYCPHGSLADQLDGTPWEPAKAAELVQTLARAIHAAHLAQVVHRDLKPPNVLLSADGQPKITDFGLAKKLDEQGQTHTGAVVGTPSYMAPEQAGGKAKEIGPAADIYALGAILYELLTGRPPFKAPSALDTLLQVLSEEPVPSRRLQTKVPRDLDTICMKCLDKDPKKRYVDAASLAEDLQRFQSGEAIQARPTSALERGWRWCRRNRALASLAASIVVGLVLSSCLLVTVRANVVAQREKAIARRVVRSLFQYPEMTRLPDEQFVDRFVSMNPDISKEDVLRAFHESAWRLRVESKSQVPTSGETDVALWSPDGERMIKFKVATDARVSAFSAGNTWSLIAQSQLSQFAAAGPASFLLGVAESVFTGEASRNLWSRQDMDAIAQSPEAGHQSAAPYNPSMFGD
jgi:serine/threonine protein kinase